MAQALYLLACPTMSSDTKCINTSAFVIRVRDWSPFDHDVMSIVGRESETIRGMTNEY